MLAGIALLSFCLRVDPHKRAFTFGARMRPRGRTSLSRLLPCAVWLVRNTREVRGA